MARVILVNEQDEEVGLCEKLEAHRRGLLHRAFSVFLFRQGGRGLEVLLQRRCQDKYHSGGVWANACCSHPRPNEALEQAVHRRLNEELGIEATLYAAGAFIYCLSVGDGLTEHELDHVWVGWLTKKVEDLHVNPEEVEGLRWMTVTDLKAALAAEHKAETRRFAIWLAPALEVALGRITRILN